MGGQGFIPDGGTGGIVEGTKESKKLEQLPGAAPRAKQQKERDLGASEQLRTSTPPAGGRVGDVHRKTEQGMSKLNDGADLDTGE
jgi:hypothetical protein